MGLQIKIKEFLAEYESKIRLQEPDGKRVTCLFNLTYMKSHQTFDVKIVINRLVRVQTFIDYFANYLTHSIH
jgi:hypothetical protein